jgi:hypothetical protein
MRASSNMFALLCPSVIPHINDLKKVISATRFRIFMTPREHPLATRSDTPNYAGRVRIFFADRGVAHFAFRG